MTRSQLDAWKRSQRSWSLFFRSSSFGLMLVGISQDLFSHLKTPTRIKVSRFKWQQSNSLLDFVCNGFSCVLFYRCSVRVGFWRWLFLPAFSPFCGVGVGPFSLSNINAAFRSYSGVREIQQRNFVSGTNIFIVKCLVF